MNRARWVVWLVVVLVRCQPTPLPPVTTPPAPSRGTLASVDRFWPADGAFPGKGRTSSWSGFRAKNTERRSLFSGRKTRDHNGIVFVGDSITEGWHTLERDFAKLPVKVVNRGIGGDTTPNLLYRLQDDVLDLEPLALVILIGTNDLGEHTPPEDIGDNLRELHRRIRAVRPEIPVVWCLVMPRGADDGYPDRIGKLNGIIRLLVAADARAILCDTFTPLAISDGSSKPEDFAPDRLHLNEAGYDVWRSKVGPILSGLHIEKR